MTQAHINDDLKDQQNKRIKTEPRDKSPSQPNRQQSVEKNVRSDTRRNENHREDQRRNEN